MSYSVKLKYKNINFQVIAAEGEQKASRALREAANVIAESSSALQVNLWKIYLSLEVNFGRFF